jgi:uncharacterized small protein (DUF1192 family)
LDARQEKLQEMQRVIGQYVLKGDGSATEVFSHFHSQNKKIMPKFVLKEMESLYVEEMTQQINLLKSNLESLPVQQTKSSTDSKFPKFGKTKT